MGPKKRRSPFYKPPIQKKLRSSVELIDSITKREDEEDNRKPQVSFNQPKKPRPAPPPTRPINGTSSISINPPVLKARSSSAPASPVKPASSRTRAAAAAAAATKNGKSTGASTGSGAAVEKSRAEQTSLASRKILHTPNVRVQTRANQTESNESGSFSAPTTPARPGLLEEDVLENPESEEEEEDEEEQTWKERYYALVKLRTTDAEEALQEYMAAQEQKEALFSKLEACEVRVQETENARWEGLYARLEELQASIGRGGMKNARRPTEEDEGGHILASLDAIRTSITKLHSAAGSRDVKIETRNGGSLREEEEAAGEGMTDALRREIAAAVERGVESSVEGLRRELRRDEGCVEHRNIITLLCLFAGIAITSIRQTSSSTVYECVSRGKAGEFVYWLSVSREAPEEVQIKAGEDGRLYEHWDNFSIDYMPVDVVGNRAIFQKLPQYFQENIAFGSLVVSING